MLMPIKWRAQLPQYTASDAGNYEGALVFGPSDYAEAASVRRTLQSGPPTFEVCVCARSTKDRLPSGCGAACFRLGMLTT